MIGHAFHGMWSAATANVRLLPFAVVVVCALWHALWVRTAGAQVLRGTARAMGSDRPVERARLIALLTDGRAVGETATDEQGRFQLTVKAGGAPFVVSITRIGMRPTLTGFLSAGARDTLEVTFRVDEEAILTDTIRVRAAPSLNEVRLREAERRGWKVFPPKEVAAIRDRVQSFEDLLRSTGYPGLLISPRRDECVRSTRTYKCVLIVLDGVPLGGSYPLINPRDVYFVAFLSPNQAMLQFGDRGPNGALVVYTRSFGDRVDKE